jgi:hypothetical protein
LEKGKKKETTTQDDIKIPKIWENYLLL